MASDGTFESDEVSPKNFWRAVERELLLLAHCKSCDRSFYYPRASCPNCGGDNLNWRQSQGRGTIYSFSHVYAALGHSSTRVDLPYTSVLVDLSEGVRMLSLLIGEDRANVKIGDEVVVTFDEQVDRKLPLFELASRHN